MANNFKDLPPMPSFNANSSAWDKWGKDTSRVLAHNSQQIDRSLSDLHSVESRVWNDNSRVSITLKETPEKNPHTTFYFDRDGNLKDFHRTDKGGQHFGVRDIISAIVRAFGS